jgi:O-antigen ligase
MLLGLFAGVAGALYAAFPQVLARHLSSVVVFTVPREDMYVEIWRTAVSVIAAHPLFGIGVHNFRFDCAQYAPPDLIEAVCRNLHPHQLWLEIFAETGLVGSILIVLFFIYALKPALSQYRNWRSRPLLGGAAMSVLLRLWPIASSQSFFVSQNEVVFWTMMAVAVACSNVSEGSAAID